MNTPRLPDGFAVQLDSRVHVDPRRRVLVGDAAPRVLARATAAVGLLKSGRLEVCDERSAALARSLLESGVAHPRPKGLPPHDDVTVVISVRDNETGLDRLLRRLGGLRVVVVDDGSARPVQRPGVRVVRHPVSRGHAAARNSGLAAVATEFVAFLRADAVPERGWLELMLGHFTDPAVALVAPRIVTDSLTGGRIARYARDCSFVDRGQREGTLQRSAGVPYVSGVALIVRRSAVDGFDESLDFAQCTDLCWRLEREGWHLRYEPIARVTLGNRVEFGGWILRNMSYGKAIGVLSARHPGQAAPIGAPQWSVAACLLAAFGGRRGLAASCGVVLAAAAHNATTVPEGTGRVNIVGRVITHDVAAGAEQTASAALRHYWPITLLAAVFSRRARRVVLASMFCEGLLDWTRHRSSDPDRLGLLAHIGLKRLDDLAFGAGLWSAVVRHRSPMGLRPHR